MTLIWREGLTVADVSRLFDVPAFALIALHPTVACVDENAAIQMYSGQAAHSHFIETACQRTTW